MKLAKVATTSASFFVDSKLVPGYLHALTLPTPFPVGPVNAYLALGDTPTLIDTGPNHPATISALRDQLAQRGVTLGDIRRIVVTHAHVDHFGLAPLIVSESGARVYSHARNRGWLTDFENEWVSRGKFYRDVFLASGSPREYVAGADGLRRLSEYGGSIPPGNFVEIGDGDSIFLGADEWSVVFAPGHASGLVCLYDSRSTTLLSNDHLIRDITSNPILEPPAHGDLKRPRALVDYIASMQRTAAMDIHVALSGHGKPLTDVRGLVAARLAFHRSRCDMLEAHVRGGVETPYELTRLLFPTLKEAELFLGLSEVIGHLDVLEEEHRVVRGERERVWRYTGTAS